jgi:hypothetical protein
MVQLTLILENLFLTGVTGGQKIIQLSVVQVKVSPSQESAAAIICGIRRCLH